MNWRTDEINTDFVVVSPTRIQNLTSMTGMAKVDSRDMLAEPAEVPLSVKNLAATTDSSLPGCKMEVDNLESSFVPYPYS